MQLICKKITAAILVFFMIVSMGNGVLHPLAQTNINQSQVSSEPTVRGENKTSKQVAAVKSDTEKSADKGSSNDNVYIDESTFPDSNFRQYLIGNTNPSYDSKHQKYYYTDAQIAALTEMNCSNHGIADLTGIKKFRRLTVLDCSNNQLENIEVISNADLEILNCSNNKLTNLDFSNNQNLITLDCSNNKLTNLDTSGLTNLQSFNSYGQISTANVRKNNQNKWTVDFEEVVGNNVDKVTLNGDWFFDENNPNIAVYNGTDKPAELEYTYATDSNGRNLEVTLDLTSMYTVTFDTAGGSEVPSQEVEYGNCATRPEDPTYEGHVFGGWYTDNIFSSEFDFNTPITCDITLYAKWVYTVTFDTAGGSEVPSQEVEEGKLVHEPTPPTYIGHTFEGWYNEVVSTTEPFDFNTPITANITLTAHWGIDINEANFSDENFRNYLINDPNAPVHTTVGEDSYYTEDQIAAITELNCANKDIADLTGITHFTNLQTLNCNDNPLTTLDVSNNTNLITLLCYHTDETTQGQLTSLTVENNNNLKTIDCHNNLLTTLDVSNNTKLEDLICSFNQLESLDVNNNVNLVNLICENNLLTENLDVSSNAQLNTLYCGNNQLTSLIFNNNAALDELDCRNNQLSSLDVSNTENLRTLYCEGNHLTNLSAWNALQELYDKEGQTSTASMRKNSQSNWSVDLKEVVGENNIGNVTLPNTTTNWNYDSTTGIAIYNGEDKPANFDYTYNVDDKGHALNVKLTLTSLPIVKFLQNDGETLASPDINAENGKIILPNEPIIPAGQISNACWYDNKECNGTPVGAAGKEISITEDTTLYAGSGFDVNFELNGGTLANPDSPVQFVLYKPQCN